MSPQGEVDRILKEHGRFIRRGKHEVWELSNHKTFVRSCTPSDSHSYDNQLQDLRKSLGIQREPQSAGKRNSKPGVLRSASITPSFVKLKTLQDALKDALS